MGTLVITKSYLAETPLMEVDIDAFRTGLTTLFNTDKLASGNFSGSMALTSAKFTGSNIINADNDGINFGNSSDAFFGIDSSKRLYWNTAVNTTEIRFYAGSTYYMELSTTFLSVPGDITLNAKMGGTNTVLQALGSYKRPMLIYNSNSTVRLENNTGTTDQTVIYFPTFAISVTESSPTKYRHAAVTATANGYGTGDAGAAQGGMRSGLSLGTNEWYYTYACKVRSGSDFSATAAKFIMVFDQTSPSPANKSTLDTRYGAGNYVYLGAIRCGFGATGDTNDIIPFKYSRHGTCMFYAISSSGYGGLNLTYTTTDADNTGAALYTIAAGQSGNVIPAIFGHVTLGLFRERASKWYIKDSSGDTVWDGGWQDDAGTIPHGFLVTIANDTNYGIYQLRKSSNAGTAKSVTLVGFVDTYRTVRRMGHGL